MKAVAPYLRIVAGMFAAVCPWLVFVDIVNGLFGESLVLLAFAVGLGYLAVGKPIREHLARRKTENDALAARAQAGREAFLAGDPSVFAPPPPEPDRRPVRRGVLIAARVAALFVVIGIVSDISDGLDAESDSATTTTSKTAATASPATSSAAFAAVPTQAATQAADPNAALATTTVMPSATTAPAIMPNVVCMNLQDSQDTTQAAGVFYSRSRDANGQGRTQVLERNWVVVDQTPLAGVAVAEGEAVLAVVKIGEPGDCS